MDKNNLEEKFTDANGIMHIIQFSGYNSKGERVRVCPNCNLEKPLSEFGERNMGDGTVRNQSWCSDCR